MTDAPERIWVEDERHIGGGVWVHNGEQPYDDPYIREYISADLVAKKDAALLAAEKFLLAYQDRERAASEWADSITLADEAAQDVGQDAERELIQTEDALDAAIANFRAAMEDTQ